MARGGRAGGDEEGGRREGEGRNGEWNGRKKAGRQEGWGRERGHLANGEGIFGSPKRRVRVGHFGHALPDAPIVPSRLVKTLMKI